MSSFSASEQESLRAENYSYGWLLHPQLQAGIKIARRNINNVRYADDTSLMEESEEELKCLLMRVKRESKKLA